MGSMTKVVDDKKELVKEIQTLDHLGARLEYYPKGDFMVRHNSESS